MIPGCIITNEVTKNKCMCADQVIYEKRVENNRNFFEIPTLFLFLEMRKLSRKLIGQIEKTYVLSDFPTLDFLVGM